MPTSLGAPAKIPLLWINQDSSSSYVRGSKENKATSAVLSYVQRRRREIERIKKGKEPPWSVLTACWPASISEVQAQLPRSYPTDNASDPFYATAVGIDAHHHIILEATFSLRVKVIFLAEAFAPRSVMRRDVYMRHDRIVAERLRRCVEDELMMYSTLAYGSKMLGWSSGRTKPDHSPEYFLDRSLRLVRGRLERGEDLQNEWFLLSVYCLAMIELWNNIPETKTLRLARELQISGREHRPLDTARIHLQALEKLVQNRGGWNTVNPYILESALLADKYVALANRSRPLIPLRSFDPGPLPEGQQWGEESSTNQLTALGTKLAHAPISVELKSVIQDITGYIRIARWAWSGVRLPSVETDRWLFLRLQSLSYQLLLLADLDSLERCVQGTLLVFLLNATKYRGAHYAARTQLGRLRATLVAARFWESAFDGNIRLWVLCTGAMIDKCPDTEWFVGMLQKSMPLPSRAELRNLLESLLYVGDKQDEQFALLADKLGL